MSDPLQQIAKDVADIKAALAAGAAAFAAALGVPLASKGAAPGGGGGDVADARELDSQYGDPQVRKDPKSSYWSGASFVGFRFSECPPDYLDATAKYKDACAFANEKEGNPAKAKYVAYDRRDAARARGWAARLRAGWKAPTANGTKPLTDEDYDSGDGNEEIPF